MTDFLAPTPRKKTTAREAARLFLLHDGICCNCGQKIRVKAHDWFIEHVDALVLGGANDDDNRRPAHLRCKAAKDASDAGKRSERDRTITSTYVVVEGERRSNWGTQRLGNGNNQHTATSPIIRKSERTGTT